MKLHYIKPVILSLIIMAGGCKSSIEIDPPKDSVVPEVLFKSDELATSALTGVYNRMQASGFASGDSFSISVMTALSADEYIGYASSLLPFYDNQVAPQNATLNNFIWFKAYQFIYTANSVLEGLEKSQQVSNNTKAQLKGEALFIRAFCNFYLVNLFGDLPLHLTTDYRINEIAKRTSTSEVNNQIIVDLNLAISLLNDSYVTTEKVRPNKDSAKALLARVYLLSNDWANAEKFSLAVIENKTLYRFELNLDNIFLKNSSEAIWQLMPAPNANTQDGFTLIPASLANVVPTYISITDGLIKAFETGDKRKTSWTKILTNSRGTFYYPFKYKIRSSTTSTEYTMLLRLSEQYFILAESLAQQNRIKESLTFINPIRKRAGLPEFPETLTKLELLELIYKERRIELFGEWGHRWFDLKRWGRADGTLKILKGTKWSVDDTFYPIPESEINSNPNIFQNKGY